MGEGGEGGMCGESNMELYITICKIDSQWEFANMTGNSYGAQEQTRGLGWQGSWEVCSGWGRHV